MKAGDEVEKKNFIQTINSTYTSMKFEIIVLEIVITPSEHKIKITHLSGLNVCLTEQREFVFIKHRRMNAMHDTELARPVGNYSSSNLF